MAIQYDFDSSIGYWVTIAALAFRRALNEELAPLGLTYRQAQVLGWLVLERELVQSDLAARMDVEPPTLAGILDRMESAGWITRARSLEDRRQKRVCLGVAAEPVWERIAACACRIRETATEGLSVEQTEQLRALLRIVHENLSRRPAAAERLSAIAANVAE